MPRAIVILLLVTTVLSGCSTNAAAPVVIAPVVTPSPAGGRFLVSVGDSYGAGFRPTDAGGTTTSSDNFVGSVATRWSRAGSGGGVVPVNFACAGATSSDLLVSRGCPAGRRAPGSPAYDDRTQADAATDFLRQNRSRVAAVTVVIGGNDINNCLSIGGGRLTDDPTTCLTSAVAALSGSLTQLLTRIRTAVGPNVPIVGLSYPDVYLALDLAGSGDLAQQSVTLFRDVLNPALAAAYRAVGGTFVDLTAAFDGYVPFASTTALAPYGTIPTAVATVCRFTFACSKQDLHPTAEGHHKIADAVLAVLPSLPTALPSPAAS